MFFRYLWASYLYCKFETLDKSLILSSPAHRSSNASPSHTSSAGTTSSKGDTTMGEETGSKEDLKSRAPVVPFDMDLYNWENPTNPEPHMVA